MIAIWNKRSLYRSLKIFTANSDILCPKQYKWTQKIDDYEKPQQNQEIVEVLNNLKIILNEFSNYIHH